MELPMIPGYDVEPVDLERDLMTIHDNWAYSISLEATKQVV